MLGDPDALMASPKLIVQSNLLVEGHRYEVSWRRGPKKLARPSKSHRMA